MMITTHPAANEKYPTREQWLEAAVTALRPLLHEVKETFLGDMRATEAQPFDVPEVRVSVGWPSKGGTRSKGKVIGQCWKGSVAMDGHPQVFISPILRPTSPIEVLGVLLHELIHAWDDCQSGHRGRFARTARAVGLAGKMTATEVEEDSELYARLRKILEDLGTFPHSGIIFEEMEKVAGKQSTRMLKLECPNDGYIVRTTQKWLDVGMPSCPCGETLELA